MITAKIIILMVFLGLAVFSLFAWFIWAVNTSPTIMKDYQSPKTPCKASWQVKVYGGNLYEVKCRKCGVRIESNGTPKCQDNERA